MVLNGYVEHQITVPSRGLPDQGRCDGRWVLIAKFSRIPVSLELFLLRCGLLSSMRCEWELVLSEVHLLIAYFQVLE